MRIIRKVEAMLAKVDRLLPNGPVGELSQEACFSINQLKPYNYDKNGKKISITQGVILRYILELSGLSFSDLNRFLPDEHEIDISIYTKFMGRDLSDIQRKEFFNFIRKDTSPSNSDFSVHLIRENIFDEKNKISSFSQLDFDLHDRIRDVPPKYLASFCSKMDNKHTVKHNSVISGLSDTGGKVKLKLHLQGDLFGSQNITCIYGPTTYADREEITLLLEEEVKDEKTSVFVIDLQQFENSRQVVIHMLYELKGFGANISTDIINDFDKLNSNRLFDELRKQLVMVELCCFAFLSFKYSDTEGESDLPVNHAIIGKDWVRLINLLFDLSGPLDSPNIHVLICTNDAPGRFEIDLPLACHVIDMYAPSTDLFKELSSNSSHPLTSKLISQTGKHVVSMRSVRVLSMLEPNTGDIASYSSFLEARRNDDTSLIDKGELDTVIYEWLKLYVCNVAQSEILERHLRFRTKEQEAVLVFLVLSAISADGIEIPTAEAVISKLVFRDNEVHNFNLTKIVKKMDGRILFSPSGTGVSYFLADPTLKELLIRNYRDETQCVSEDVDFPQLLFLRARLELAKHIFVSLAKQFGCDFIEGTIKGGLPSNLLAEQFGCVFFEGVIKRELPSDLTVKRLSMLIDNLLQICDPRIGCDPSIRYNDSELDKESEMPELNNFDDKCGLERMCKSFLKLDIIAIHISELESDEYGKTLEYQNVPLLRFCMQIIYFGLDLQENYASTRFIDNGDKLRFFLLKRFFQIRGNGSVFKSTDVTSSSVFSVLPQSVVAALRDKTGASSNHFFQSLLTSAKRLDKMGDCISILSQTDYLRHVREAHKTGASDSFESFSKIGDQKNLTHFTVLKLKVYLLNGYLDAVSKWGEYFLRDKQESIHGTDSNQKKSNSIMSLLIEAYIAQAKYGKAMEWIEAGSKDLDHNSKSALTGRYSACIRLKTLSAANSNSSLITNSKAFSKMYEKLSNSMNKAYELRERFSNLITNIYKNPNDQQVSLSTADYQPYLELRSREHITIAMLTISGKILETESILDIGERRLQRIEQLYEIKLILKYIDRLKRVDMLPIKYISYQIGYIRFSLYRTFCWNMLPTDRLLARIQQLAKKCSQYYPLYYCQLLILEAEYLRQKKQTQERMYTQKLIEIENLILKLGYSDRFFELYCLRDEVVNTPESQALWLVQ